MSVRDPSSGFPVTELGDSPELSAELVGLVLSGRKTGTSSLLRAYECEGEPLPEGGEIAVLLDADGRPVAVLETTEVSIVPFEEVSEAFARSEGEGDLSLRHWRDEHWRFFGRECQRYGLAADRQMLVVCERFRVVTPGTPPRA